NKNFQEDFLKEIKNLQQTKDIIVVHESDAVDQRLKLFKALLKECKCQEFALMDRKNIKVWAIKEFEKSNAKINNDALDLLLQYVGADVWRLSSEIKKLTDFKIKEVLKKEDVVLMVRPTIETDIFKTIDALAEKNKMQAL